MFIARVRNNYAVPEVQDWTVLVRRLVGKGQIMFTHRNPGEMQMKLNENIIDLVRVYLMYSLCNSGC
jgi:hypothetical protein